MTIRLSKDLETSIRALVRDGRFASVDDAMNEAARLLLKRQEPEATGPMSKEAFHRHLIDIGLMTRLPDAGNDRDDPDDRPVAIEGEPLSETIIRERR